jgi:hypothetical protein
MTLSQEHPSDELSGRDLLELVSEQMKSLTGTTVKLCECGCGQPAPMSNKTSQVQGLVKGQPRRFVAGHYRPPRSQAWYPVKSVQFHPRAKHRGDRRAFVAEHILVAEAALGRYLPDGAEVHHVDENKANNANSNLVICQDHRYHFLLHARARVVKAGGDPNADKICCRCGRVKPLEEFNLSRKLKATGRQSRCRDCSRDLEALRPKRRR